MSDVAINPLNEDGLPKSEKQLEKEAKKAAKLAKFNEKKTAIAKAAATDVNKTKEKKNLKKEEVKLFFSKKFHVLNHFIFEHIY